MFRLESNRLAAKRAYYRRLDKVAAMQQDNKNLQDICEDQKSRINVYEILVRSICCAAADLHLVRADRCALFCYSYGV